MLTIVRYTRGKLSVVVDVEGIRSSELSQGVWYVLKLALHSNANVLLRPLVLTVDVRALTKAHVSAYHGLARESKFCCICSVGATRKMDESGQIQQQQNCM